MTRKMIAPIALALVLGALPASAASRSDDRDRNREREAHRSHMNEQEAKVASLASRLDDATSKLFSEAVESRRHRSWRDARAIRSLRRLEREADRFEAVVERRGARSRHADAAFEKLECAYQDAVARRGDLRRSRQLRDEFARVGQLIEKVDGRLVKLDRAQENRSYGRNRGDEDRSYGRNRGDEDRSYGRNRGDEDRSYGRNRGDDDDRHAERRFDERDWRALVAFRFGF